MAISMTPLGVKLVFGKLDKNFETSEFLQDLAINSQPGKMSCNAVYWFILPTAQKVTKNQ